jgi:uncharacterized RDD family membrane protein YckC
VHNNHFDPFLTPPVEYLRASFGKRLLAFVIDVLIVVVASLFLALAMYMAGIKWSLVQPKDVASISALYQQLGINTSTIRTVIDLVGAYSVSTIVATLLYMGIEATTAATPGKRIVGLVVTRIDGRPGDTALWTRRVIVKHLSTILAVIAVIPELSLFSGIGFFYSMLFYVGCFFALGEARLAMHDRILQTAVMPKDDVQS